MIATSTLSIWLMSHFSLWSHFSDTLRHRVCSWAGVWRKSCGKTLPATSNHTSEVPEDKIINQRSGAAWHTQPEQDLGHHHKKRFCGKCWALTEDREQGEQGALIVFGSRQGMTGSRVKQAGHRWHKGTTASVPGSLPSPAHLALPPDSRSGWQKAAPQLQPGTQREAGKSQPDTFINIKNRQTSTNSAKT